MRYFILAGGMWFAFCFNTLVMEAIADPPRVVVNHSVARSNDEIVAAMQQVWDVNLENVPLFELAAEATEQLGITVLIDHRTLDTLGIGVDYLVTLKASQITVDGVFSLALDQTDLTWLPYKGVILITSQEEADYLLITQVYDTTELLGTEADGGMTFESLIKLITATVAPTSWDQVGGPGSIREFRLPNGRAGLVVSQTQSIQGSLAELLRELQGLSATKQE